VWRGSRRGERRRRPSVAVRPASGRALTTRAQAESRHARPPHPRICDAVTASTTNRGPNPARTPTTRGKERRSAEPESRRRHWHPAVLGVGAAVSAARRLVGGDRC
jgi:hypothetical protein